MLAGVHIIDFIPLAPASSAQGYSESAAYLLWFFFYELTVGPVAYIVIREAFNAKIDARGVISVYIFSFSFQRSKCACFVVDCQGSGKPSYIFGGGSLQH